MELMGGGRKTLVRGVLNYWGGGCSIIRAGACGEARIPKNTRCQIRPNKSILCENDVGALL